MRIIAALFAVAGLLTFGTVAAAPESQSTEPLRAKAMRADDHTDRPLWTTTTQAPPKPAPEAAEAPAPNVEPPPLPLPDDWQSTFQRLSSTLPGTWAVADRGSWGATRLSTGEVYVSPDTPLWALPSVMLHEAAHVIQGRKWGGHKGATAKLAQFGGIEVVADCMALLMGATWIDYGCPAEGRHGALLTLE